MAESKSAALPLGDVPMMLSSIGRVIPARKAPHPNATIPAGRWLRRRRLRRLVLRRLRSRLHLSRSFAPAGRPAGFRSISQHLADDRLRFQWRAPADHWWCRARSRSHRGWHPSQASGNSAGAENAPCLARNTEGVGTATPGLTSTMPKLGRRGAGRKISPTPPIRAGAKSRQTGTSAPSPSAISCSGALGLPKLGPAGATPPPHRPNRRRCLTPPAGFSPG